MAEGDGEKQTTQRYSLEDAVALGRHLTGSSAHVVAGALSADPSDRETWTQNQIEKAVKDFAKRPEEGHEDKSYAGAEAA